MPFEVVGSGGRQFVGNVYETVTLAYTVQDSSRGAFSFAFRFGENVLRKLGWQVGVTRVCVLEGNGPDAGLLKFIRAAPDARPSYAISESGGKSGGKHGSVKLAQGILRRHYTLPGTHAATEVAFQAFGGEALILLPFWIKPIEQKEHAA